METTIAEQPSCLCIFLILQLGRRRLARTELAAAWPLRGFLLPLSSRVRRLAPGGLAIVVALYAMAARADTIVYSVQDLGVLPGASAAGSAPTGINSGGQVTGSSDGYVSGTGLAFIWTSPGPMQSLGTLPGSVSSQGISINDSGWVCGQSDGVGFVYTPQTGMQSVGFLPGGDYSELCSINNSDVAVGACTSGTGAAHAAIWDPTNGLRDLNKMIVNPPAGWNPTVASLIDENGLIAGIGFANTSTTPPSGKEYAFVLNAGTLTTIPNPSGSIYVEGINSSGEVVGSYNGARAFEYTLAGGIHDIGTLGGPYAWATGVNDLGDIVGESVLSDGSDAAFLYTNGGGMVNLSAIVSLPDGFSMGSASGINDRGQIIAQGVSSEDQAAHTFLLTPTPEPSTFVLVITFACFFLILHLCRRRLARS